MFGGMIAFRRHYNCNSIQGLVVGLIIALLAASGVALAQDPAPGDAGPVEEQGQTAGASGVGTTSLLVTSTQCFQIGCSVEDAVLRYNGSTGAYIGTLIPAVTDPWALSIHPIRESLLVVSRADNSVREYDPVTGAFTRVLVKPGAEGLNAPQGMALTPGGRLFISSNQTAGQLTKFNGILEFDSTTGAFIRNIVDGGSSVSETCSNPICLRGPNTMLVAPNNHIYVVSSINDSVQEYLLDGTFLGAFTSAKLLGPRGIAIRPPGTTNAGNLMVSTGWINPNNDLDDSVLEFNGATRGLVATNGGVFGTSALIRSGPLAWHTDGNLLIGERAGELAPFFADRVGRKNGTTGASMAQFTTVGDTHAHQLTALLHVHVNFATDDSDADGDTDLKDLFNFQNCFASSNSSQCLTPFDDNKTTTIGRWDFLAFLGNLHGPKKPCTSVSQCNDGDVCTTDACTNGFCVYTAAADGTNCSDGLFCNGPETCSSGVCRGRSTCIDSTHCNETTDTCKQCLVNSECDDQNPCTDDTCSVNFTCQHAAHTRSCDDGNPCTTNDKCAAGACVGGAPPNCNDNNVCTTDTCDVILGCIHTDNLLPCDDGNACSLQDFCLQGTCRQGRERNCDDNNPCTDDSCNVNSGCVHHNNADTCDDGDPCTEGDVCAAGQCHGAPKNCADTVACTVDKCVNGVCQNVADNSRCSNGNWCDGTETCNAITGCQPGTPPCDDNIACTTDNCDPDAQTCSHTANNAACSNGLFCDGVETCSLTLGCQPGTPPNCNDNVTCTVDSCDEQNDICLHTPNAASCADTNVCTDDVCSPTGCLHPFNTASCNDGLNCTINDTCANGTCSGAPKTCPAGQTCDPADGVCKTCLNDGQCNDSNPCTNDTCNAGSCVYTNNTATCNDGLFCTLTDTCSGGSCVGSGNRCPGQLCDETTDACVECLTAADCQDNNVCTNNVCNNGVCQFPNNSVVCDDGLFCTVSDTCAGGSCNGVPRDCSAQNGQCTTGVCNENTDACVAQPKPNNSPCDDGLFCTVNDSCTGGSCAGSPRDCSAQNGQCTTGVCDETSDACVGQAKPINTPCDDGLFCTQNDKCNATGSCILSTPRDCSSLDTECAEGVCNETSDTCVAQNLPNGTGCDDGLLCTADDSCQNGVCGGDDPCPGQFCIEATGNCVECLSAADCHEDANVCTTKVCSSGVCGFINNTALCNDGDFCTATDTCQNGTCVGSGDPCPGQLCNETTNTCVECLTVADCEDDGNPCTDTVCVNGSCGDVNNTATCNDGFACTVNDQCSGGLCSGSPRNCDDSINCTLDTCEEPTGCVHTPDDGACDDGLFCNGEETCNPGSGCENGSDPCQPNETCDEQDNVCVP